MTTDCTSPNHQGGWDSHRWETGYQSRLAEKLTLFCNQCGCELQVLIPIEGYEWEVGEVNEKANTVYLYDRENMDKELTLDVLEATA